MKIFNKTTKYTLITIVLLVVLFGLNKIFVAKAQINPLYNFKGKVTTATSTPVADGEYNLSFALYTTPTGGASIWNESLTAASRFSATVSSSVVGATTITYLYGSDANENTLRVGQHISSGGATALIVDFDTVGNSVTVAGTAPVWANGAAINNRPRLIGGVLDVDLGTVASLAAVNFNQPLYLEVTFDAETMQPRKLIASVPQAFNAAKLNGLDSSAFINTSDDITATGRWTINNTLRVSTSSATTSLTVVQGGAGDILRLNNGTSDVLTVLANGNVGIGTSSPSELLQVMGNIKLSGDLIPMNSTQDIGSAITRIETGYFTNLDVLNFTIGSTSISGTVSNVFTINSDNVSVDTEDSFLAFHRGSSTPADAVIFWNSTDDRFETNFPLHLQANNFTTLGNIGIGTTTTGERLSVIGNISVTGNVDGYDISAYGPYFIDSAGSSGNLWQSDGSGRGVWTSTSTLGLTTDGVLEAGNLYWTDDRFDARLAISTSAPALTAIGTISTGIWNASTIGIGYGGTGRTGWTANAIVYASSTNVLGEILPGTPGQILTMSGSIPSWQTLASATPALHDLLSSSHGDTTAAAVQNGDLITGQTGRWARLGIGGSGQVLLVSAGQPTWTSTSSLGFEPAFGTLSIAKGGTNNTTYANNEFLIFNGTSITASGFGTSSYSQVGHSHAYEPVITASSTTAYWRGDKTWQTLNTMAVPETGTNLYWSQNRFDTALAATSSISTITSLPGLASSTNLTAIGTITTGVWNGSTIGVAYGGTARTSFSPNALLYASASTTIGEIATGTEGYALVMVGGVPAWSSTVAPSIHNIFSSSHGDATGTPLTGDIIFRNASSQWTNLAVGSAGQVLWSNGSIPAWIATSSLGFESAFSILSVSKGGTGTTTFANNEFLIFNGTNIVASGFSTSSFASTSHTHDFGTILLGATGQIPFYGADGTTLMATSTLFITSDGRVGIGTTTVAIGGAQNPRLQVAGAVAANFYCDENGNNCVDASNGWIMQSVFVGTSTVQTDGDFATSTLVGYQAANSICAAQYAGSHFCRTDEIIYTIQASSTSNFSGTAWIAEGPPGYTSNSNDCNGWKSSSTVALGAFWLYEAAGGGAGWLTNCSNIKPISCCR